MVARKPVHQGERVISRKAVAQGRPGVLRCPVCSCAFCCVQTARETAGAARTRSSLRPLTERAGSLRAKPRAHCVARSRKRVRSSWASGSDAVLQTAKPGPDEFGEFEFARPYPARILV